MKVAIDLRPLQVGHQNRGIGNYLLNILKYFPDEKIHYVFVRYRNSNPIEDYSINIGANNHEEVLVSLHKFSRNPSKLILFFLNKLDPVYLRVLTRRPRVYFQPDYLLGTPRLWGVKKIVVAYDLIPFLFKEMYLPNWRKFARRRNQRIRARLLASVRSFYYERKYKRSLRALKRANLIISISETTTDDLVEVGGLSKKKIVTTPLAPSFVPIVKTQNDRQIVGKIKQFSGPYLVFIGGTDARRQVHELIYAFNLLNARGYDFSLVLAGSEFVEKSKELNPRTRSAIEESSYRNKIHMLGKISEQEKRFILENAFAFVYPTLYEGFGLPVLEAMASSCPVITYDSPAVREVCSNAALYVDEKNGFGIFKSIIGLEDEKKRKTLTKKGIQRAGLYSWKETGRKTINAIFES